MQSNPSVDVEKYIPYDRCDEITIRYTANKLHKSFFNHIPYASLLTGASDNSMNAVYVNYVEAVNISIFRRNLILLQPRVELPSLLVFFQRTGVSCVKEAE